MHVKLLVSGVVGAVLLAGSVVAHEGATGVVKERMDMMENLKSVMKTLAPMVKGQKDMDAAVIAEQAKIIQMNTGAALDAKFPENSIHGPSEALPAIWEKWDEFQRLSKKLNEASVKLASVAGDEAAVKGAFKEIAQTCGACHDQFKKD